MCFTKTIRGFAELLADGVDPSVTSGQPFFLEGLDIDGALVLDLELEFPAPVDERGFGDFQVFGDAGEAPALSASEDELLLSFDISHSSAFIHPVLERNWMSALRGA